MIDLFLFAGEPSGDVHGGHLLKALKREFSSLTISGVGGPQMRSQGLKPIFPMESFEVMGFTDVFCALPTLYSHFKKIKNYILLHKPRVLVLIDYPGFNLRLAKAVRKGGYQGKIVQFISPTVWAHGSKRIQLMAENIDLLMTIYPFELACYTKTALSVIYIGNPLQKYVKEYIYDSSWIAELKEKKILSLFPGSRKSEINQNLPKLLEAASLLKKENSEAVIAISCAHEETFKLVQKLIEKADLRLNQDTYLVPKHFTYELMRASHVALAKSGTVTLELALHCCPTVVVYHLNAINRFIAKWILHLNLPFYCIVNILLNKKVFSELIKENFSSHEVLLEARELWKVGAIRETCLKGCKELSALLENKDPSREAALAIQSLIEEQP